MKKIPLKDRLLNGFERSGTCWVWKGTICQKGYGRISVHSRYRSAHRTSYEFFKAPIPHGLQLDHLCRNRSCINPDHLEPVTASENIRRGTSIAAVLAKKTHCKRGHLLAGTNLRPGKTRQCRTCSNERDRTRRARRKEDDK